MSLGVHALGRSLMSVQGRCQFPGQVSKFGAATWLDKHRREPNNLTSLLAIGSGCDAAIHDAEATRHQPGAYLSTCCVRRASVWRGEYEELVRSLMKC